MILELEKYKKL